MTSINLMVTGAQARASVTGPLTSGMVGVPVTIEYDEAWDGLTKNLMCRCSPWGSNSGEIRTLLNVGETSTVAHEVMQPDMYLYLGVEGFSDDGKLVIPTTWARCGKIEYGANTCEDPSTDPELPVWNQLQIEMEKTKEYVLTPEQAVNIQSYAQTATQAAQEARQAAEEAKQAVESGLYYMPSVSQPTDATLKFEFKPSITGAPIPKPVTVELPVGSGDPGEELLTVETITVGEESDEPMAVTGLVLDYTRASLIVGETMHLACSVIPGNASNTAITWESSDSGVAEIDNGLITAVAAGDAVITARSVDDPDITAVCAVSVEAAESGGDGEDTGDGAGDASGKIPLSTATVVDGSCVKRDGSVVTVSAKAHYCEIPYTDGMFVSTGVNSSWAAGSYVPLIVNENGTYSVPAYTSGTAIEGMSSQGSPYLYTATLTGYAEGTVVIVNMTYSDISAMESSGAYYYIPSGGES